MQQLNNNPQQASAALGYVEMCRRVCERGRESAGHKYSVADRCGIAEEYSHIYHYEAITHMAEDG